MEDLVSSFDEAHHFLYARLTLDESRLRRRNGGAISTKTRISPQLPATGDFGITRISAKIVHVDDWSEQGSTAECGGQ